MAINLSAGHISAGTGFGGTPGVQGNYEVQRQNNWYFEVSPPSAGNNDTKRVIELALDLGFLPNESSEEIEIHFVNERVYVAGKPLYEAGTLTLKDYVDQPVMKTVADWRARVYDPNTGAIGLARNYKVDANIVLFAPDGSFRREWLLRGCWPSAVNYGATLDMATAEQNKIELTIRYDKALPINLVGASDRSA